jgi:uncharacterized membrane protein SirB2
MYKFIHIASIVLFFISLGAIFRSTEKSKFHNIMLGVTSLIILVGGMGLIARMGIPHGGKWPAWLHAKFTIWGILVIAAPIMAKKVKTKRGQALAFFTALGIIAVYIATNKPF